MKKQTLPLSDLLAHRDGERLDPRVAQQIEADDEARSTLRTLRQIKHQLGDLEPVPPPPDLWDAIQARSNRPDRNRRMPYQLATAAAVFLAAALTIVVFNPLENGIPVDNDSTEILPIAAINPLPGLLNESRRLENLLSFASTANQNDSAQQALVYRIADIDAELTRLSVSDTPDNARLAELWRQRVTLLESLTDVQRGEASLRTAIY